MEIESKEDRRQRFVMPDRRSIIKRMPTESKKGAQGNVGEQQNYVQNVIVLLPITVL